MENITSLSNKLIDSLDNLNNLLQIPLKKVSNNTNMPNLTNAEKTADKDKPTDKPESSPIRNIHIQNFSQNPNNAQHTHNIIQSSQLKSEIDPKKLSSKNNPVVTSKEILTIKKNSSMKMNPPEKLNTEKLIKHIKNNSNTNSTNSGTGTTLNIINISTQKSEVKPKLINFKVDKKIK